MLDLEEGNPTYAPRPDGRPILPVAPPVRLLSVSDVTLPIPAGHEKWLDGFYLGVLEFEPFDPANPIRTLKYEETIRTASQSTPRLPGKSAPDRIPTAGPRYYRAENFILRCLPVGRVTSDELKYVQLEVPRLELIVGRLLELQIPYERIRGLLPGMVKVQITDPAGHVIEISEGRNLPL